MKFRLLLVLFLSLISYLLSPASLYAITPFAPYSVEGNPDDDYQLKSFFPLLRFIKPETLIVYENQDASRTYSNSCSDPQYFEGSCSNSQDCRASTSCDGKKTVFYGTCNIASNSSTGTCSYPKKNPTVIIDPKATDFSRDSSSAAKDTPNLTYPKYQNEALRYQNPGGTNTITWGSHYLQLPRCERAARQLMVAYQAYETKNTVDKTNEWPLGWVDWGFTTRYEDKTLLEVWSLLESAGLSDIAQELVKAQDTFLQSLGGDTPPTLPSSSSPVRDLCNKIGSSSPDTPWLTALELLPLYPPSFRQGYVRTSICVFDVCKPGDGSSAGQGLYADTSIHSALSAAIADLLQNYPLAQSTKMLNDIAKNNPLLRYILISKPLATPTQIARTLDPLTQLSPFTFGSLGHVYDYQDLMNQYGYTLQESQTQQEGGAFPTGNFTSRVINFAYGIVDAIAPVTNHLLTIPEVQGQTITQVQQPVYDSRDITNTLKDLAVNFNSNVIDGTSILLYVGKGIGPGDAKRRLAYFTCKDPEYSDPKESSIKDYALGTRLGCYSNPAPSGACDGAAFTRLMSNPGQATIPSTLTPQADSTFASMQSRLTPELLNIYGAASAATGVPCEILAGIHYVEADLNPQGSLVSGRPLGQPEPDAGGRTFSTLLDTAVYAGNALKGKMSGATSSVGNMITALSRYNGGGNSNCQSGYPYPIPYTGCPRDFEGEDDPYAVGSLDDKHSTMYLLYCEDLVACEPVVWDRIGTFTFALEMHNNLTSQGATP